MFLNNVLVSSKQNLKRSKKTCPIEELMLQAKSRPPALSLSKVLRKDKIQLIAEVKKASPSKGLICRKFDHVSIAKTYAENGAAAISVLTEINYFQGRIDFLSDIKKSLNNPTPLLRKDFLVDPYQIYESRSYSADALLLIAAVLPPFELSEMLRLSHELGMECLVEIHTKTELQEALKAGARIVGINNRDLSTFNVDLATTRLLKPLIPPDIIVVSESGIRDRADIEELENIGVDAALVGESLISFSGYYLKNEGTNEMTRIKICGITDPKHAMVVSRLGVDFIGMVFASSLRKVSPQKALEIVQSCAEIKPRPSTVGVFVNLKPEEVNGIAEYCRLDWVQLSGNETFDYCRQIERPIIKAIKVDSTKQNGKLCEALFFGQKNFAREKLMFLLDTKENGSYGGSGKSFDWSLIPSLSEELPVLIAGGLNQQNVSSLIELRHPWGVDVSSGVETNGSKDISLINSFVKEVRENESK